MGRAIALVGMMLAMVAAQAQAVVEKELELKSDTIRVVLVPGVTRVFVEDENIVTANTTGEPNQVLVKAVHFGKTELCCRDETGGETKFAVTVKPRFWNVLLQRLVDYPQLEIKMEDDYITVSGEVMKTKDRERILDVAKLDPEGIIIDVTISTVGLAREIEELLKQRGYEDIAIKVVGNTVQIEGEMYDKQRCEQLVKIVESYAEPFGAKVDDTGLIVAEANLTVEVQFVQVDKSSMKDLGLEVGSVGIGATGTGTFAKGIGPAWSAEAVGSVGATIHKLKENHKAKTKYQATVGIKSGEEARVHHGGKRIIKVSGVESGDVKEIEYGFIVTVVPKLLDRETIEMAANVQVIGTPQANGDIFDVSQFDTKASYTMKPGETIILSGLKQDYESMMKTGEPFLSKIPLLGRLFGSSHRDKKDTDILLLITVDWKKLEDARKRFEDLRRTKIEVPRP